MLPARPDIWNEQLTQVMARRQIGLRSQMGQGHSSREYRTLAHPNRSWTFHKSHFANCITATSPSFIRHLDFGLSLAQDFPKQLLPERLQ